jgi:hypothetical protein
MTNQMSAEDRAAVDAIKARLRAEGHVTARSSDEDIAFLVAGAEGTVGHPLPGLEAALTELRRQLLTTISVEDL